MQDDFDDVVVETDFKERVSPHELTGAKRQQWMAELWRAFNDLAVKGSITLADALTITESLHVDGEEHFLEEHVPDPKEITFKQLAQTLDDMSRSSGNEYRDVELDRVVAEDGSQVEFLGPIDYLRYVCGGRQAVAVDGATAAVDTNVEYRLQITKGELTPKQMLIITTVSLLLLIAGCITIGMLVMWDFTITEAVRRNLRVIHGGVSVFIDTMETKLLELHALGIISTTELLARWNEVLSDNRRRHILIENQFTAVHLAELADRTAAATANTANLPSVVRLEVVDALVTSGFNVSVEDTDAILEGVAVPASSSCDRQRRTLPNGSAVCVATVDSSPMFEAAMNAANDELGNAEALSVVIGSATHNVLTMHAGQCATAPDDPPELDFCASMVQNVGTALDDGHMGGELHGIRNDSYIVGAVRSRSGLTVSVQTSLPWLLEQFRWTLVDIVNYLNFEFVRSTEIVISLRDQKSGVITAQATMFRFQPGCFVQCDRFPPSSVNVLAAFRKKDSGWDLTPDYRPEPVIGGYSYVGNDLDLAIVFERDVIEVRGISFGVVREVIQSVNRELSGELALELVGYRGLPLMQNFPAFAPCPSDTDCVVDSRGWADESGHGSYYRYNCRHCQRIPATDIRGDTLVNYGCADPDGCDTGSSVARETLESRDQGTRLSTETREQEKTFVASSYAINYSLAVSLSAPYSESVTKFQITISAVAGGAVGMLLLGLLALIGSSMSSFSALEEEWSNYKDQLQQEKVKFGSLVQGLIPPAVAERLMAGNRILADHVSAASFVFVDVCSFSDMTKNWSSRHIARYMTYCVSLLESVANHCELLKLRSIGDLVVVVGLRDERHRTEPEYHPARRALQFSSIAMLLFSKLYVHRPQTSRAFRELFKDKMREGNNLEMPALRVGVHCGPTISGAFTIGKASHYDFFGPGPALANRMQQTALPNRIHVTVMVKEMLRNRDPNGKYLFDHSRKTVVRGHGTITSYFVRTITEHVPYELIRANGIDYARTRFDFQKGLKHRQTVTTDAESVVSSLSGDEK